MISFTGIGFPLIIFIYFGGIFLVGQLIRNFNLSYNMQNILLIITHLSLILINYFIAKLLNRKEVKHTVFEARLEKVVLFFGLITSFLIIMMVGISVYKDLYDTY
ncbi:hypothetical protein [Oceanivirga salmonicida]|uniref:hypothetical protein n=1 Tax=Oceanivirga salmonicida TaxID=1769291 RepID=UPI00082B475F|nr:hypothetical protein [Oceanivirga salmonicida]